MLLRFNEKQLPSNSCNSQIMGERNELKSLGKRGPGIIIVVNKFSLLTRRLG